jgi:hypothetical protein
MTDILLYKIIRRSILLLVSFTVVLAVLPFSLESAEPVTRADWLEKQREAKEAEAEAARVEEDHWVVRAILHLESRRGHRYIVSYKGFSLKVATVRTGSGIGTGVNYWRPNLFGASTDLLINTGITVENYHLHFIQIGELQPRSLFWYLEARYRYFPQEHFFGLGRISQDDVECTFLQENKIYSGLLGYVWNDRLTTSGRGGFIRTEVRQGKDRDDPSIGDVYTDLEAPGLERQPDAIFGIFNATLDLTNREGKPHTGGIYDFEIGRYDDRNSDLFKFTRTALDVKHFIPVLSEGRIFYTRMFLNYDDPAEDARVPFYLQQTLGGNEMLRGYEQIRFRGNVLLYLDAEYRWRANEFWELALFYEVGNAFHELDEITLGDLEYSYGFQTGLTAGRSSILTAGIGRSEEQIRYYIGFGEIF